MLKSMTGYGQATGDYDKFSVKAEFKSLNGKFLDVNLRMPKLLQSKEIEIRNQYQKLLERGSVTLMLVVMGLSRRKWIDFGRQEKLILPYLATVTGHGVLGLGLVALTRGMHPLLLGSGLALFMISDYFLMAYKFKCPRNAVLRFNSGTYFLGMLLVALSFSY